MEKVLSVLTSRQVKQFGPVYYTEKGTKYSIIAKVRYDDECGNGHNTFAITADIDALHGNRWMEFAGGCCHDEVARHFPELRPFIKWHLCSSDGPMYYLANTLYHAGNRDHNGRLAGEVRTVKTAIQFGNFPILYRGPEEFIQWLKNGHEKNNKIVAIDHEEKKTYGTKYTFAGYCSEWYQCPFDSMLEAEEFLEALNKFYPVTFKTIPDSFGEGKERDLDAARESAIWPDATDAELCADDLKERLIARLPALLAEFKKDMETLGFIF